MWGLRAHAPCAEMAETTGSERAPLGQRGRGGHGAEPVSPKPLSTIYKADSKVFKTDPA